MLLEGKFIAGNTVLVELSITGEGLVIKKKS
jgi:hypothetical protein